MLQILSIIFLMMSVTIQSNPVHLEETHHGVTLSATRQRVDGDWQMVVRGEGQHTFDFYRGDAQRHYYPETILVHENQFYLTGYIIEDDAITRNINAFIMIIALTGTITLEEVIVDDYYTSLVQLIPMDDVLFIHLRHESLNEYDGFEFYQDAVQLWENNQYSQSYTFDQRILRMHAEGSFLLFSNHYHGPFEMMIDDKAELVTEPQLYGVVDQGVYYDVVTLYFNDILVYNDKTYVKPVTFNHPGNYQFEFNHHQYQITLHPSTEGVYENMVTNQAVVIDYEVGMPFLNGKPYAPKEIIDYPGHYQLIFENTNYRYAIPFTITSQLHGVFDRQTYHESRKITFRGEGYLNNQYIESGMVINESGKYTLQIFGENDYQEKHHFTIELESPQNDVNLLMIVEVSLLVCALGLSMLFIIKTLKRT